MLETLAEFNLFSSFSVIIAGKLMDGEFSDEELRYINKISQTFSNSIFYMPTTIEAEGEFNYLIRKSDIVWALYDNFSYSSNMLVKACYYNKLLIGSENTYIGNQIEQYKLGYVSKYSPFSLKKALEDFLKNEKEVDSRSIPGRKKYLELNSEEKYMKYCEQLLIT